MALETNHDVAAELGTNIQPHGSSNRETPLLACQYLQLTCRKTKYSQRLRNAFCSYMAFQFSTSLKQNRNYMPSDFPR